MTVKELNELLASNPDKGIQIAFQDNIVPAHYHVTEVGRVTKQFVDCGGTFRQHDSCLIQIWTANDKEHRVDTNKLSKIMQVASSLLEDRLPVEAEYGEGAASQYRLESCGVSDKMVMLAFEPKKTNCLAPDKCGIKGCC